MVAAKREWPKAAEFGDLIVSMGIVGFFNKPVQIKRGLFSNFYVNWRTPSADAYMLDKITDYILDFISFEGLKPRCIYGVPEGATKWGIVTQFKFARQMADFAPGKYPIPLGRSSPKEHGMPQDRYFVGPPSGPTIILEDVTVEGEALLNVIDKLQSIKVPIIAAVALTDRNEKGPDGKSVEETLKERGVRFYAMSNAADFLPRAFKKYKPGAPVARAIEEEFRQRGVKRLKLI